MSAVTPPSAIGEPKPKAIYVWLVPSEQVLEQPGHWRIRKWDTEPFPEANFVASQSAPMNARGSSEGAGSGYRLDQEHRLSKPEVAGENPAPSTPLSAIEAKDEKRINWMQDNLTVIRDIGWLAGQDLRNAIDAATDRTGRTE